MLNPIKILSFKNHESEPAEFTRFRTPIPTTLLDDFKKPPSSLFRKFITMCDTAPAQTNTVDNLPADKITPPKAGAADALTTPTQEVHPACPPSHI